MADIRRDKERDELIDISEAVAYDFFFNSPNLQFLETEILLVVESDDGGALD